MGKYDDKVTFLTPGCPFQAPKEEAAQELQRALGHDPADGVVPSQLPPYRMLTRDARYWREFDDAAGVISLRRAFWAIKGGQTIGFTPPELRLGERPTRAPVLRQLAQRVAMAVGTHRRMVINSLMLQVAVEDLRWRWRQEPMEA